MTLSGACFLFYFFNSFGIQCGNWNIRRCNRDALQPETVCSLPLQNVKRKCGIERSQSTELFPSPFGHQLKFADKVGKKVALPSIRSIHVHVGPLSDTLTVVYNIHSKRGKEKASFRKRFRIVFVWHPSHTHNYQPPSIDKQGKVTYQQYKISSTRKLTPYKTMVTSLLESSLFMENV